MGNRCADIFIGWQLECAAVVRLAWLVWLATEQTHCGVGVEFVVFWEAFGVKLIYENAKWPNTCSDLTWDVVAHGVLSAPTTMTTTARHLGSRFLLQSKVLCRCVCC